MGTSWKLHHIAVVVRNIDEAVRYYESTGMGVFSREVIFPEPKPNVRAVFVDIGSVPIEFLQPLDQGSPYWEFLNRKGEGVQHIAFAVDNLDDETTKFVDKGLAVVIRGKAPAAFGSESVHLDTHQVGDFNIQLIQESE